MRAVHIVKFGAPHEAVELVNVAEPPLPGHADVLVAIEYAPVNPNDLLVMGGQFPHKPALDTPLGNEGVGRVLAVGSGVENVAVGDRVVPPLYSGTWRERMIFPAQGLFALPEADPKQLAMLRINPPTAALLLSEYVDLQDGDWVVQNAGNSGVGRAVIAIAKAHGHRTISFVRRREVVPELEAVGGDLVLVDGADAEDRVKAAVGDGRIKLALDGVSGPAAARLAEFLSPGGALVGYAMMSGETAIPADLRGLMGKRISLASFYQNRPENRAKVPAILPHAARLIAQGSINVPIAAIYPLSKIKDAIAHVERGGKVLLDVASAERA